MPSPLCRMQVSLARLNSTCPRWHGRGSGGRSWQCDGNVKQTIRTRTPNCNCVAVSISLPLSLPPSLSFSLPLSACAAKNAVVSLSQLPTRSPVAVASCRCRCRCPFAHCSLALLLLLALQLLPLLGRLRKPEVVNIHVKTQPAFNVLASAPCSQLPAARPRRMTLICNEKSINENAAKNTFVTVWESALWQRGKLLELTARTQYKDRKLGRITEGSRKVETRRRRKRN